MYRTIITIFIFFIFSNTAHLQTKNNSKIYHETWIDMNIPAVVEAWFSCQWGGNALADVLFGGYIPGGKLSITFPKTVGQIPLNFLYKPGSDAGSGNNIRINEVLYPFGHGLSFTEFKYSDLKINTSEQNSEGNISVSFNIEKRGIFYVMRLHNFT